MIHVHLSGKLSLIVEEHIFVTYICTAGLGPLADLSKSQMRNNFIDKTSIFQKTKTAIPVLCANPLPVVS